MWDEDERKLEGNSKCARKYYHVNFIIPSYEGESFGVIWYISWIASNAFLSFKVLGSEWLGRFFFHIHRISPYAPTTTTNNRAEASKRCFLSLESSGSSHCVSAVGWWLIENTHQLTVTMQCCNRSIFDVINSTIYLLALHLVGWILLIVQCSWMCPHAVHKTFFFLFLLR